MSRRLLPKRLEEDLKNAPRYKPGIGKLQDEAQSLLEESEKNKFSVEKLMFDEMFGPVSGRSNSISNQNKASYQNSKFDTDIGSDNSNVIEEKNVENDFTAILVNRLTTAEADLKSTRVQLAEKLRRIDKLENENNELKILVDTKRNNSSDSQILQLRRENSNLIRQISEMEQFLADYGLVWVGFKPQQDHTLGSGSGSDSSSSTDAHTNTHSKTGQQATGEHMVSFNAFQTKVNELNDLIRNEPMQIKMEDGNARRARLVHTEESVGSIRVTYFCNGLLVRRGPFRPCNSDSYCSFVRDIMDGFFPSEFRKDCPDGVILDLRDRQHEEYVEGRTQTEDPMTQQQLLNRLPKIVVRNGEVVHVRDEVAARLRGVDGPAEGSGYGSGMGSMSAQHVPPYAGRGAVFIEPVPANDAANATSTSANNASNAASTATATATTAAVDGGTDSVGSSVEMATVQVRWVQGGQVLVVRVPRVGSVADVQAEVRRHFGPSCPAFELRSAYPPRSLPPSLGLGEAGLLPNGTVHARLV